MSDKPARPPISKKTRFEVFKRDKFTCQYCGARAPDVVLHADHIKPVADGGETTLLNLVTSCLPCNLGKGARALSDDSAITKQQKQIEELQDRREQIDMLIDWQRSLSDLTADQALTISDRLHELTGYGASESGMRTIKTWIRKYPINEILEAVEISVERYMECDKDGSATDDSWGTVFHKIPKIVAIRRQEAEQPGLSRLFYIQGILRNRLKDKWGKYVDALGDMVNAGASIDRLEGLAKAANDWDGFCDDVNRYLVKKGSDDG